MNLQSSQLSSCLGIPIISSTRRYWFVRTNGGTYYKDFLSKDCIAIGYEKITSVLTSKILEKLLSVSSPDVHAFNKIYQDCKNILKYTIQTTYPQEARPALISGYILHMIYDIKKGDIVLIPSQNSSEICFGEVISDKAYYEDKQSLQEDIEANRKAMTGKIICPFVLRKKVKWIKTVKREQIDLHLVKAFFSHNAISNIDRYGYTIDRSINQIFIKNDQLHYKMNITTRAPITMDSYLRLMCSMKDVIADFNEYCGKEVCSFDNMSIKMQAESPGFSEIISMIGANLGHLPPVLIVITIIVALIGGKIKFCGFSFETKGILPLLFDWYKYRKEHPTKEIKNLEDSYNALQSADNIIAFNHEENNKSKANIDDSKK